MAVTRSQVIEAFRWILGREPESEDAIAWHLRHADIHALRVSLLNSHEFREAHQRLLEYINPMLLVSTTLALWLLDLDSGQAWQIDAGRGAYCGVSFDQDRIYVACREVAYARDRESQDNAILCLDRKLRLVEVLRAPQPIRDVHQIFCHRGTLFVCSTYDDAVMEYEVARGTWNVWQPFPAEAKGLRDEHHINSIFVRDDMIVLAGSQPAGWFARFNRDRKPLENGRQLMGSMSHNVWLEDEEVCVCSSGEGTLTSTSGMRRLIHPRAWLRGLCRVGMQFYVGISQELHRSARAASDCSIVMVGGEGRLERCYSFLGFGVISDLRTLGISDTTHNGISFTLDPGAIDSRFQKYETRSTLIDL